MAASNLEKRVQVLEEEVAELKRRLASHRSPIEPWWRKIAGTFPGDAIDEEAFRLGQEWRKRENAKSLRKTHKKRKRPKNARS
jgi:hypothetical protein